MKKATRFRFTVHHFDFTLSRTVAAELVTGVRQRAIFGPLFHATFSGRSSNLAIYVRV